MKKTIISICFCLIALASRAQPAITEAMSSESTNGVVAGPDFWELTNFGTNTVDLSGYLFNDADATRGGDADSITLSGVSIGPGESIILVQSGTTVVQSRDDFINWWGASSLPTNLQVLFYTGNGLSGSGDSVVLWSPTAVSDGDYVDRTDFGEAIRGHSFTYDTNGIFGTISSIGVGGAFTAGTSDDIGSPGHTTGAIALAFVKTLAPTSLTVPAGSAATFTVAARGMPHPHFQWLAHGTNYDGGVQSVLTNGIQSTLIITNAQFSDAGTYSVVVSNGLQRIVSTAAQLTVTTSPVAPTFLSAPVNADAFFGQTVQLNAQPIGSPTPGLYWEKDGAPIPGQTSSQLFLGNVQVTDGGTYKLIATNSAGSNSVSSVVTVGAKPRLLITEVHPSGSGETGHADWWELTSFDTRSFNLRGWRWDDNSHSVAPGNAYMFTNDILIHPGETEVFVENITPAQFRTWWGTNLPPSLQINTYIGGGLGLSQTADEVNLWNAVTMVGNELTERICGVNFATSFVGSTLVYDPLNPPLGGVFNVFSTNTVAGTAASGIFQAAQLGSWGSPGDVVAPIRVSTTLSGGNLVLNWNSFAGGNYTVQYTTSLSAPAWLTLTNVTATGTNTSCMDPLGSGSRFYRVAVGIPVVSEP